MADKKITSVDFVKLLNSNESFFINQNNAIKQISIDDIIFGISNGGTGADNVSDARINLGLGVVAIENVLPIAKGGTNATNGAEGLGNLLAAGETILSEFQYGDDLPEAGKVGRIFFKKKVDG